jgi:hypothetical protein
MRPSPRELWPYQLLRDYTAGDAVAGGAGGIGLVVIGFGVDDDGGAAVAEQRVGVVAESHVVVLHLRVGFAFCVDGKILHVSRVVAFRIFESVMLALRIEMSAGGLEVRAIALGSLMKVDSVLAGRQVVKMKLQGDSLSLLPYEDVSDGLALGVFEFDFGFGGAREGGGEQNGGEGDHEKSKVVHARIIELCGPPAPMCHAGSTAGRSILR